MPNNDSVRSSTSRFKQELDSLVGGDLFSLSQPESDDSWTADDNDDNDTDNNDDKGNN